MDENITIKQLKGFVNTSIEFKIEGVLIGQNGEPFSVLDIKKYASYYTIEKLALALSRSIRYLGNSKMTVAQHCVRGAEFFILMGDIKNAYNFLMHEVSEPFGVSDISTPVKRILGKNLKEIEYHIESELSKIFEFDHPFPPAIKSVDVNLATDEMVMMRHGDIDFDYWNQEKSYTQFMVTYNKLKVYDIYQSRDVV